MWAATVVAARRRAAVAGPFAGVRHILLIVAHPDDETVFAPLLGSLCVEGAATCSFLVMTRGERGVCSLPLGCFPDLATVREREMQSSAAMFRARLTQWSYPDVMQNVGEEWAAAAGGRDALLERIRQVIESEQPSLLLTFDPGHGTTCHPAHREIGRLVIEAAGIRPLYLLETLVRIEGGSYSFLNAHPSAAWSVDAGSSWRYLVDVAATHASQFTYQQVGSLNAVPLEQRRVYLASPGTLPAVPVISCD